MATATAKETWPDNVTIIMTKSESRMIAQNGGQTYYHVQENTRYTMPIGVAFEYIKRGVAKPAPESKNDCDRFVAHVERRQLAFKAEQTERRKGELRKRIEEVKAEYGTLLPHEEERREKVGLALKRYKEELASL
ncbi:MAG TPA: hypothetical protein VEJ63_05660 [Planctomycetota bacterium]|nr:hypothetical protein [Planctomycetota bacterium]